MKLELLDIMAHRVVDPETGKQFLRLSIDNIYSWYRLADTGFDVISDDSLLDASLEAAFQVNLTRKVASWAN